MSRFVVFTVLTAACATHDAVEPQGPAADAVTAEAAPAPEAGDWRHFGEPFALEATLPAATLLSDPASYVDRTVRVQGRVTDDCQQAGCWLVMADQDKLIRVTMKEHGFAVDKGGAGSDCEVEGTVVALAQDPERTEHFKSESGEGAVLPEAQATGETLYEIVATGVRMKGATEG